jgi:hypothetical protein
MRFTGKNLELVFRALHHAIGDVNMHIGSCPDVIEYADDIEQLERERDEYVLLLLRVEKRLGGSEACQIDGNS